MDYYTAASIPVLFFLLWLYTAAMSQRLPTLNSKRILLLIAHPDDEAMFFAPTIQSLIRPELSNQLKILCLSSGDAHGIGEMRLKELRRSATILGLDGAKDVVTVDDPNLQDGPHRWDTAYISRLLSNTFASKLSSTAKDKPHTSLIDAIITFDEGGVSAHPNHASCYGGATAFLGELNRGREGWESPVAVYALRTVNVWRKYSHAADALMSIVLNLVGLARLPLKERTSGAPPRLLFVSGAQRWARAQRAMVQGHWSQMLWFRWGWIGLGRYLIVNDLVKVTVA